MPVKPSPLLRGERIPKLTFPKHGHKQETKCRKDEYKNQTGGKIKLVYPYNRTLFSNKKK